MVRISIWNRIKQKGQKAWKRIRERSTPLKKSKRMMKDEIKAMEKQLEEYLETLNSKEIDKEKLNKARELFKKIEKTKKKLEQLNQK